MRDTDRSTDERSENGQTRDDLEREIESLRQQVREIDEGCRQTMARLRRSEESFRRIFEHSNDGILVLDGRCERILDANARACRMLGYDRDEMLRLPVSAIHPDEMPRLRSFADSVAQAGEGWTDELACLTRNGVALPVEISASVIETPEGNRIIAMVRDISHRKEVEDRLRRANLRMKNDLEAAARIQRSLLPTQSPLVNGVRFAWRVEPCVELAGDILNVFPFDRNHLGVYILDVSGHGVAAAMLARTLHKFLQPDPHGASILTREEREGDGRRIVSPARVCERLNRLFPLDPDTDPELQQYFTLLYGVFDSSMREFRYASAGHCSPIYCAPGRAPVEVAEYGFPIGMIEGAAYEERVITMELCSRLHLYSDGLVEADDASDKPFGVQRLRQAVDESRTLAVQESVDHIFRRVDTHVGGRPLEDDVSLLVLEMC